MEDAEVPAEARVRLSIGCLKGSANEWGEYKEDEFNSFPHFLNAFRNRYWDSKAEMLLFNKI